MPSNSQMLAALYGTIAVWMLEGAFLSLSRDATRKRRLLPRILVGGTILLTGFYAALRLPLGVVLAAVPVIAALAYLNWRVLWFCDACGLTARAWRSRAAFCSDCGAPRPRGDA
jgi:hypothetical protein